MSYGDEQQQLISDLKVKVDECRAQYKYWHGWCRKYGQLEVWQDIEPAIILKADYYKAEIIRAKHNIARYMLGRDTQDVRYTGMWLEDIDYQLEHLPEEVANLEILWDRVQAAKDRSEVYQQLANSLYEGANLSYDITRKALRDDVEWGRRKLYAGTV